MTSEQIIFNPIGYIRRQSLKSVKNYEYPAQGYMDDLDYIITLLPGNNFEQGLKDLAGFSHIWIIFHFNKSKSWKPLVVPPRGPAVKRGVFATRSPHRPNGVGMTVVKLNNIAGKVLSVNGGDFLDQTPVLDIKPYISASDSLSNVRDGWAGDLELHRWDVIWDPKLLNQARKVEKDFGFSLKKYCDKVLQYSRDPHPYRRIKLISSSRGVLSVKRWRVSFALNPQEKRVVIEKIILFEK